jgi:hypothetical protein
MGNATARRVILCHYSNPRIRNSVEETDSESISAENSTDGMNRDSKYIPPIFSEEKQRGQAARIPVEILTSRIGGTSCGGTWP